MTPNTNHNTVAQQLETVWIRDRPRAIRLVAAKARRPADDPTVQDAMAATFERLHRLLARGGRFDNDDAVGWLTLVGRREFLRLTRCDHRTVTLTGDVEVALEDPDPDPETAHTQRDAEAQIAPVLARALARLSPVQRSVLNGVANGDSYHEIQERLHLSYTAVNKALYRARRRLRQDGELARELDRLAG